MHTRNANIIASAFANPALYGGDGVSEIYRADLHAKDVGAVISAEADFTQRAALQTSLSSRLGVESSSSKYAMALPSIPSRAARSKACAGFGRSRNTTSCRDRCSHKVGVIRWENQNAQWVPSASSISPTKANRLHKWGTHKE
jgi:hypothetical protein